MKKITGLAILALSVACMLCGCSFGGKEAKKSDRNLVFLCSRIKC